MDHINEFLVKSSEQVCDIDIVNGYLPFALLVNPIMNRTARGSVFCVLSSKIFSVRDILDKNGFKYVRYGNNTTA